jgi:transcription antitermination factor NusG
MSKAWMAVYTKPRSEKKVAERLEKIGIEVYCPLQTVIKQWSDRKKKVKIPVFPSYVFVHIEESERLTVLSDTGVMNFVFWLGKPAVIREEEMDMIQSFHESEDVEFLEVLDYKKGNVIDILEGPLKGNKGKVFEITKKQVTLLVESLNMVIKVTFKRKAID